MNEELPEYPGIVELVRCFESAAEAADELERFFGDNPDFADNLQARIDELRADIEKCLAAMRSTAEYMDSSPFWEDNDVAERLRDVAREVTGSRTGLDTHDNVR